LAKFAWGPIISALDEREQAIESAILAAENARNEMANLKSQNESFFRKPDWKEISLSRKHQKLLSV
jgi:F-type H+-transporting ATPase subunit b